MMKTSEFLKAAKAIIDTPEKWTTCYLARDKNGDEVQVTSPDAVCFCSYGAIAKLEHQLGVEEESSFSAGYLFYLRKASNQLNGDYPADYNDTHTYQEVMVMWDLAINFAIADETA